jgi:sigma-E factor negative regulatory protein RseA
MNDQNTSSHLAASLLEESLSALMDGQVSELELQRILKATSEDADLRAKWDRYHVAHAALKKDFTHLAPAGFASRISAAIDAEDKLEIVQSQNLKTKTSGGSAVLAINNWWANIGRVAIAASVAGAVVLGVQQMQTQPGASSDLVASSEKMTPLVQEQSAVNLPSGINAPELTARTVAVQSGFESRPNQNRRVAFVPRQSAQPVNADEVSAYVNELMEVHSDNAARNSGQGVLPFTRVILTEDE